ncbi:MULTISPECIES: molybdate ABC transporter substrate-binding protein [unclassified Frondihabitans]|uniref:molybdate ABC transporter substrate-binding protein n=1 Tax=unclassified Frondihabitans TaxID=2626248 RepID=UPI000F5018E4|nr:MULTISPECIES: molybdate ABC transporter substrate-binding protein [unclassified Frondihabitans]RPE76026.1 molybdate transport system substrate-binding protein [Frondihabitans sp. PhB153]RPF05697.1 molybdate transport system substrate-binding protein [Frondihabitans sp. PhB161]
MRPLARTSGLLAVTAALALGLAACSSGGTPAATTSTTSGTGDLTGSITVYGAASLTATFTQLASDFEKANPGVSVKTTFNGSSVLVTQIQSGAPADVFASADTANMTKLTDADLVTGTPTDFATNTLEIAVPTGNPKNISTFTDLAKSGVKTVVCASAVPCGAATEKIEAATGVTLKPVSEETAVTGVLSKVETGEADAGLVYVTDVKSADGKVDGVTFDDSKEAVNTYPIATLKDSSNKAAADAFVKYVAGAEGQKVLAAAGFGQP